MRLKFFHFFIAVSVSLLGETVGAQPIRAPLLPPVLPPTTLSRNLQPLPTVPDGNAPAQKQPEAGPCRIEGPVKTSIQADGEGGDVFVRLVSNRPGCVLGVASSVDWLEVGLDREEDLVHLRLPPYRGKELRGAEVYIATKNQTITMRVQQKGSAAFEAAEDQAAPYQ
jgi:hypothetical protein